MTMTKRFLFLVFAAFSLVQNLAAQTIKVADVLATASDDVRLSRSAGLQNLAQGLKMHDPVIRQVGVRVGINGSALGDTIYGYLRNEDTYQLQVGFNSLSERLRQRQIKTARIEVLAAEDRALRQQVLLERYDALSGYLYAKPKLDACRRLDTLLQKEHRILRDMLNTGVLDVKVAKVLDAEEDLNRNRVAMQEIENERSLYHNRIRRFAGDFSDLDDSDVAAAADLRTTIHTLQATANQAPNVDLDLKNAEVRLKMAELKYVSSQNKQVFDNFTIGYQRPLYLERPKNFNTLNNISFRIGLTAPLPSNNRFKKSDALLDLREAENDAALVVEERQKDLGNQFVRLDNLFREYDLIQERLDSSLIRKMLENNDLRAQITPLEIVELEISLQKLSITQAGLLKDIAEEYIRLLELTGAVGSNPGTNYLSRR
jgi:hypothetical protein